VLLEYPPQSFCKFLLNKFKLCKVKVQCPYFAQLKQGLSTKNEKISQLLLNFVST